MQTNINQYFKYITVNDEDRKLGAYLEAAGYEAIISPVEYPLTDHPSNHYYHWETGRRLSEYQILYITQGGGVFESEFTATQQMKAGDVFFLFPDVWHRFYSDKNTGWTVYWIEFNGKFMEHIRDTNLLDPEKPIVSIGTENDLIDSFIKIIDLIKEEKTAFQYLASGLIIQIIGQIFALKKIGPSENHSVDNKIRLAKLKIYKTPEAVISPEALANELGMDYSYFRKKFKKETGFSPVQFQIQTRINKAKNLLSTTNFTIKKIAELTGFESDYYFSRLFKQKTGTTPVEFRERNKK